MGKRKEDRPSLDTQARASGEPETIASPSRPDVAPPARIAAPPATVATLDTQAIAARSAAAPASTPEISSPSIAAVDAPKPAPTIAERLNARLDGMRARGRAAATAVAGWSRAQVDCLTPFAASIAIAAAVGALTGSIATMVFDAVHARTLAMQSADAPPSRDAMARINADLVALKAAIDTSGRSSTSQLVKLNDRLDHVEHAQAEPAARAAKLSDAVERRAPASQTTANDVTGSIASTAPSSPSPVAASVRPEGPPVLGGWVVRGVYNGVALIQGRMGSMMEVEPGDYLPGLGRIETIRRQDGHWVVITSKGLIVAR